MKKWVGGIVQFFRDMATFIKIRKEQRKLYSPIIDDLEIINALANALSNQIRKFSGRWNMFPETKVLLETYKTYVEKSRTIFGQTRKEILNSLFAERNKKQIEETDSSLQVHRTSEKGDGINALADAVSRENSLVGKILDTCEMRKVGGTLYITIDSKNRMFVNTLLKSRKMVEAHCSDLYDEEIVVEIVDKEAVPV